MSERRTRQRPRYRAVGIQPVSVVPVERWTAERRRFLAAVVYPDVVESEIDRFVHDHPGTVSRILRGQLVRGDREW